MNLYSNQHLENNTPASAARSFLTKAIVDGGRGWTITDGGYQP